MKYGKVILLVLMTIICVTIYACATGPAKRLNAKDFGATGDGNTNDTKAIQAAIDDANKGDTVFIPEGTYIVKTLVLRSHVHVVGVGLLQQQLDSLQEFRNDRQASSAPLFRGREVSTIYISVKGKAQHEAIYVDNSNNIKINDSHFTGDSTTMRSFAGIMMFQCKNVSITNSSVRYFGAARRHVKTYQRGTGIRISSGNEIVIKNCDVDYNGENAVFMHSVTDAVIEGCRFSHNGMSGIQVAFGSSGKERNYTFANNIIEDNAADAIDINNRSPKSFLDIHCVIRDNKTQRNGFVKGQSTPDGSGIATLINVSGVRVINNSALGNNRPAIYLESCGIIDVERNTSDGRVEIVKTLSMANIVHNKFSNVKLLAQANAGKIFLQDNKLENIYLPNGITIDSLILNNNTLSHAAMNFNLQGNVMMIGNTIESEAANGALLFVLVNSATLTRNIITSKKSAAVVVRNMTKHFVIVDNTISSVDACIVEDGSEGLKITNNKLTSLKGGETRYTLRSKNPNKLVLEKNKHTGIKKQIVISFEGEGTASMLKEKIIRGTVSNGHVTVTKK